MVEFQVIENKNARPIMDKLASLVEKSRIILVSLDHEGRVFSPQLVSGCQIERDSSDEIPGDDPTCSKA